MEEKVLAIVNGKNITQNDLDITLKKIPPQQAAQFHSDSGKQQLLHELIKQELMYLDAIDSKLDEEEEFLTQFEMIKSDVLKQYAIHKFFSSINITDNEIADYYENNKSEFNAQESTKASHILVDSEEKANMIIDEINIGLQFDEAAKKYSSCPSKEVGGDLGFFESGNMVPEFEKVAFTLEKNQISGPVKTQFGYHIIKTTDKKPARQQLLEEVKEDIRRQLEMEKQSEMFQTKINSLENKYKVEIL